MLTLFSYPGLYGLADNNPYGLKVYAFLRLCRLEFRHEHILDARAAPRGQLPYIVDEGETVGDSDGIVAHLTAKHHPPIDLDLTPTQRTLDDLYWVMSYSRWHDPRYWPTFRDAILETHPGVTAGELEAARAYNAVYGRSPLCKGFLGEAWHARCELLTCIRPSVGRTAASLDG